MRITLTLISLISLSAFGQVDFDNYTTLLSSGAIPEDFTKPTYEKLEEDLSTGTDQNLSVRDERIFFEGINYAIDDLMHSGYVIFGDPISEYITEVAQKLLKGEKELRDKLRFYVLKSNSTNAFSTEQGIVFVTTGLISQITSEAQLAYVLAHEIAHYQKHDVLESFTYKRNNKRQSIEQMSVYSKEKELAADKIGLKMYANAGYSRDEVIPTFDVLLYSYLPFDEIEVPNSYFYSNDSLYVPDFLFPDEDFPIKAAEDDDDSKSSHPNVKTRKETIMKELDEIKSWGTDVNKLGDEKFEYIRNIARFEAVRSNVYEANYGKALYSIFLMEREFPESSFLKRMKAHAWLGILQYRVDNSTSEVVMKKRDFEGASATVHYFIRQMSKDELITMCVRQIYDVYSADTTDVETSLIFDRMVKELVYSEDFDKSEYAEFSFNTAYDKYLASKEKDTTQVENTVEEKKETKSKYDRIKTKRDPNIVETDHFDSTEFRIYLIPDVIQNEEFLNLLAKHQEKYDTIKANEEKFNNLSYRDRKQILEEFEKDRLKLGLKEVISLEPYVISFKGYGVDRVKSEKLEAIVSEKMDEASNMTGLDVYNLVSPTEESNVSLFNERALLLNFLEQMSQNEDVNAFPVDYSLLKNIENNYGTSKVMFSVVSHVYDVDISYGAAFWSVVFYPVGLIYFPLALTSGHHMSLNVVILDTNEGTVDGAADLYFKSGLNQHVIGANFYNLFNLLKTER